MQALINNILYKFLKNFVIAYLNDIIIYFKTKKNHVQHINKIFKIFKNKNLRLKLKKCKWYKQKVDFLKYIIKINGIKMDFNKIKLILK